MADPNVKTTLLSWLEEALRAERQAVNSALAKQHAELLEGLAPRLPDAQWIACPGLRRAASDAVCFEDVCRAEQVSQVNGLVNSHDAPYSSQPQAEVVVAPPGTIGVPPPPANSDIQAAHPPLSGLGVPEPPVALSPWADIVDTVDDGSSQSGKHKTNNDLVRGSSSLKAKKDHPFPHSPTPSEETYDEGIASCMERFVASAWFETLFAALIVMNTLVMAVECQYQGIDNGFTVGYPGSTDSARNLWPNAEEAFEVFEWIFGVAFTIELVLKLVCMRTRFCKDLWNILDTIIVGSWLFGAVSTAQLPLDPMLLRLARLARLLRLLRLVRTIRLFDSLYLMTTAMKGSFAVLLWSVVLLALVQMMLAFLLQQMCEGYILNEDNPEVKRKEVYRFYGSFARSMLTMFEITLGNWMVPCRALVENISEWYMLFSLAHKLAIGFSVVSVITAVFIQETFKVATFDDRVMLMSNERARKTHAAKICDFFRYADKSRDGFLDLEEFSQVIEEEEVRNWLAAMELNVPDTGKFYKLLDKEHDGKISFEELLSGVGRLKGNARSFDVVSLQVMAAENTALLQELKSKIEELKTLH